MILGFHYHIPAIKKDNHIYLPGYLGVFLDGLASHCQELICYMHTPLSNEMYKMDYKITSSNIKLINIGSHINVFKRVLKHKSFLKNIESDIKQQKIDLFLIRAPSPLLPFITKICIENHLKYSYLIVGNYLKNLKETKNIIYPKRFFLSLFYKYNKYYQDKYAKNSLLFTNNPTIFNEYKTYNIYEIRTTTLREKDFYFKKDFYKKEELNLLYAGRIEPSKGIDDILSAMQMLIKENIKVIFHLVGWDDSKNEIYLTAIQKKVQQLNLTNNFIFHGKKSVGKELFTMYRKSDIYILATNGDEGFPRTIWEAMANSSIVISTNAGSIGNILTDRHNVLLVNKNSPIEIFSSIIELLNNNNLRDKIREEGFKLSKTNTIEKQSIKMISIIKDYLRNE
jgi:glycosyltransferase involved in cell wall biosynthesis